MKAFNYNDLPINPKDRLNEQLKFFGFRSKRYVSVYAKKPRIRIKNVGGCYSDCHGVLRDLHLDSLKREASVHQARARHDASIAMSQAQQQSLGEIGTIGMMRAMGGQSALSGMSGTSNNWFGW